jgi:hypothetical protein
MHHLKNEFSTIDIHLSMWNLNKCFGSFNMLLSSLRQNMASMIDPSQLGWSFIPFIVKLNPSLIMDAMFWHSEAR